MSYRRKLNKKLKKLIPEFNPSEVPFNYGKVANWRLNLNQDKSYKAGKVIIK